MLAIVKEDMMDGKISWIGKKVYVILKSGRKYSGVIQTQENSIFTLIDKYYEPVMFSVLDISSMEVEG